MRTAHAISSNRGASRSTPTHGHYGIHDHVSTVEVERSVEIPEPHLWREVGKSLEAPRSVRVRWQFECHVPEVGQGLDRIERLGTDLIGLHAEENDPEQGHRVAGAPNALVQLKVDTVRGFKHNPRSREAQVPIAVRPQAHE